MKKKILWLCKNQEEFDSLSEALVLQGVSESSLVDPYGPKKFREVYCFIFETRDYFDYKLIDLKEFTSRAQAFDLFSSGSAETLESLVTDADLIVLPQYFDRLHIPEKVGDAMSEVGELAVVQDKQTVLLTCDVKFKLVTKYIKANPDYKGEEDQPKNIYPEFVHPDQKFEVIFAATDGISHSEFYRIFLPAYWRTKDTNGVWHLNPDRQGTITFSSVEWVMLQTPLIKAEYGLWKKSRSETPADTINRFYYGIDRPGVAKSLKAMGLGSDPNDAVFGKISKVFPDVRDLCSYDEDNKWMPNQWRTHLAASKIILFPHEPVKTDFELTTRVIEYFLYSSSGVQVECDKDVRQDIKDIFADETGEKLDYWYRKSIDDTVGLLNRLSS